MHRSWSAILDGLCLVYVLFQLTFFLQVILTLGGSILVSRFLTWVSSHYHWTRLTLPSEGILEIAFSLSVYWLTVSFVGYWGHRFLHTPLLWPLHRFHHAATELNMITAYRQHPVESVATGFFSLVSPFIFLNVPDQVIFPFFVWGIVAGLLEHSQLPWEYGWVGRWVIGSPRYHQIHHSIDEEHQNLHFGSPSGIVCSERTTKERRNLRVSAQRITHTSCGRSLSSRGMPGSSTATCSVGSYRVVTDSQPDSRAASIDGAWRCDRHPRMTPCLRRMMLLGHSSSLWESR